LGEKEIVMRRIVFLSSFALAFCICLAGEPPFKPGGNLGVEPPIGRLGYRIGTYLTIEGVRAEEGKVGVQTLLVDRIGDYKLKEPVGLWIANLELRPLRRYILSGYESGSWIGIPPGVPHEGPGPQAAWQFASHFIVTSVGTNETQSAK